MNIIDELDKNRIISFINENELDYIISNDDIIKFHVTALDDMKFFFYKTENKYIVSKYNIKKDRFDGGPSDPYEYYQFDNISQIIEQLKYYDDQIPKKYWDTTSNSIEIGFDDDGYTEDWFKFLDDDLHNIENNNKYNYVIYNNDKYKPSIQSPFNIHDIELNRYTKLDNLYFEIHPISCRDKQESYLLKLKCNSDNVFKEYINYIVNKKKGLQLFLINLFDTMKPFLEN